MLTKGQQKYLDSLDDVRIAKIILFDPKSLKTGNQIVKELNKNFENTKVYYIGSSVLQIAGENDIDISVVSNLNNFLSDLEIIRKEFGEPKEIKLEKAFVKWEFIRNGFQVELYLNGEMSTILKEQVFTHNILVVDPSLKKEYENMKLKFDGKIWKEYMAAKIKFFNKVLTNRKPNVYLLCGLPGSGKSTWSEKFVSENPNTVWYKLDKEFFKKHKSSFYGEKFKVYDAEIQAEILEKVKIDLLNKRDVILDYGFWEKTDRNKYGEIILNLNAIPKLLYFKVNKEILLERLSKRNLQNLESEHKIDKDMFEIFFQKFQEPKDEIFDIIDV